ncbi:Uncharacterized protein BM_BM1425 [Brugia malayi]|uniref:G_PROTEIN_RECEP_F1_2 domain-containing protein n=4 Tax=Brugia TaxID=6278 RepID=A0A4E9F1X7_BRUMA|nr:Uncharacterized protein BM_BM1425 [Brugia malayi]VIO88480.1 Uncharacterized protein BM_BM1425 [Brugia malayi]
MGNRTQLDANVITYAFAIPLGLLGLFAYGITLYIINKSPRYRNAFGILFTAYISFHIQTLSALLLWTIIRIIVNLGFTSFPWHIFIRIASPISNSTLYAAIWMHFVLAINRLWAISYPMKYHRIFNPKNAWITVISLWSFSMLITLLYYNVECLLYVEAYIHSWSNLYGPCNHPFFAYIAMFLSDGVIVITVIIDAIAFYRIITYFKGKNSEGANGMQRRMKREIIFFKETCTSTIIHVFFVVIFRFNLPMSRFTKITYTWLAILTLDGLAFVYFNRYLLMKQNAISLSTNTMGLRTKTMRNDLNTAAICTAANNIVNIASMKRK